MVNKHLPNIKLSTDGKSSSLCLNCFCKWCGLCSPPAFLWGIWNFGMLQALAHLCDPAFSKNHGCRLSNEPPGRGGLSAVSCWGELKASCETPFREDSWDFAPGFLCVVSPLLIFLFTTMNLSCECDCMVSPSRPSSESPNLQVVLGTPNRKWNRVS